MSPPTALALPARSGRHGPHRRSWATVAGRLAMAWCACALAALAADAPEPALPRPTVTLGLLAQRHQIQSANLRGFTQFQPFAFSNRLAASGITFQHRAVDDAGRNYKAVQYDHGNAVAAADVDRDGLPDLYFTSQLGRNELWRNRGGGRFEDLTDRAGIALAGQISVAAAFADLDHDGDPDLVVTTVRHGNHLFRNRGDGTFEDVTAGSGFEYSGHSSGIAIADLDLDGRLDIFVANVGTYTTPTRGSDGAFVGLTDAFSGHLFPERTERSRLYRNLGDGKFAEVGQEYGVVEPTWCGDASFMDLDGDRYPELYLVNMQGDDRFYRNRGGRSFALATDATFPKTPWGATGIKFLDANSDGRMDLFVTDMHSDMTQPQTEAGARFQLRVEKAKSEAYCTVQWTEAYLQGSTNNLFGNALYLQRADGTFEEASDRYGVETYWPWGASAGDLDADGHTDLFVTAGMGFPFRYAVNSVLLNDGGRRFFDAEFVLGVEPRAQGRIGKVWFTLDCSGADRNHPGCAGQSGSVPTPGALSSRSSVLLDLDGDGDLDIVTNDFHDAPQILINDLAERRAPAYLQVRLVGTRSNRDGLGARVRVRAAGGRTWTQVHDGKSGYLAQSALPLYFGLGDTTALEAIEILWPSGAEQLLKSPALRTLVTATEP
ncbi:MAG: CRTAC1 family protein [Verrucomicrobiales bacterium]|nr:CRTAC1 family protein [Verrucomicrobiales bacterium]